MLFSGIVENSGFVQVAIDGRLLNLKKQKLSKKYAKVSANIPDGAIVKVKSYSVSQFAKKAMEDGWYRLTESGMESCEAPAIDSKTVYLHEIYEELANPQGYEG